MKLGFSIEKTLIKKGEAEDRSNYTESAVDRTDVKGGAVHPENDYNNESHEGFLKPESKFVPIEDVSSGESEDDFINKLSAKLEQEMVASEDKYDFLPLLTGLAETAKKKGGKELDDFITKANKFVTRYREILESGLSDERNEKKESEGPEYESCRKAFKEIFGEIIYSDGEMESYKHGYIRTNQPPVNEKGMIELGNKIFYDKRGVGYLKEREAKEANTEIENRRNNKRVGQKV